MPDRHTELELKFAADKVPPRDFVERCMGRHPSRYDHEATFPDVYYVQNDNVVRHRWIPGGAGELTVKRRRSKKNSTNREEIDLLFAPGISLPDVTSFLDATGWKRLFTLLKSDVHSFWFPLEWGHVNVAMYTVERLNEKTRKHELRKRFVEVEVEKGSDITLDASTGVLTSWKHWLDNQFAIGEPLNVSLYEIYSGQSYKLDSLDKKKKG